MLMRMPVRMVGAAAGRITSKALRSGAHLQRAGHVEPLAPHAGHAEGGVDQHRPHRADEDHEDAADRRVLDRVERQRHPGQRRDGLEHLDERVERAVASAGSCRSRSPAESPPAQRQQEAQADAAQRVARAGCRCPCRSGRCRRTGWPGCFDDRRAHLRQRREARLRRRRPRACRRVLAHQLGVLDLLGRQRRRRRSRRRARTAWPGARPPARRSRISADSRPARKPQAARETHAGLTLRSRLIAKLSA